MDWYQRRDLIALVQISRLIDIFSRVQTFEQELEAVKRAEYPETEFNERFDSWIDHWEDKFTEVHGRQVPEEQQEEIVRLLVDELRLRAGVE